MENIFYVDGHNVVRVHIMHILFDVVSTKVVFQKPMVQKFASLIHFVEHCRQFESSCFQKEQLIGIRCISFKSGMKMKCDFSIFIFLQNVPSVKLLQEFTPNIISRLYNGGLYNVIFKKHCRLHVWVHTFRNGSWSVKIL